MEKKLKAENIINDAEKFTNTAEEFLFNNNNKEAIKCYLNSVLLKRLNPKAYKGLGKAYRSMKNFDKAISYLEKAKEIMPFDEEIYSELGICFLGKGLFCKAVKNFIQAIKLNPDNTDTQIQLAVTHEIMGEEDMAIKIYQKIMETNPDCEKAYIQKASLLMQLDMFKDAIDVFVDILSLNPKYYRSYLGIGICLDKLGETSKAKRYYKKYLTLMPEAPNKKNVLTRMEKINTSKTKVLSVLKIV